MFRLVEGESFKERIRRKEFEIEEVWDIMNSLIGVLGYLEKNNVKDFDWQDSHLLVQLFFFYFFLVFCIIFKINILFFP